MLELIRRRGRIMCCLMRSVVLPSRQAAVPYTDGLPGKDVANAPGALVLIRLCFGVV